MPENETNGEENIGTVRSISINEEMRGSYLDYAMSVIVARALPDARDGLKPVHRRILYAMYDMGLRPQTPYKKSARIVGEVLGKYHPHGDSAVYDAMARMAQDFSLRYPLVDGQGNFGSVDGDSPAAMRYTEARMAQITIELLQDIHMNTVNFTENYDGSQMEPEVLPARLPNLLLNGTSGIAVGMATNIPPHNLRELIQAITYIIDNYESLDDITIEDLMQFVKGPDFPTGAEIAVTDDLKEAYATGKGRVAIRATYDVEEGRNGLRLVFRSIPYQVSKSGIIERIVGLVREGRIETIRDLRDESDRQGMRLVVELKSNASPHTVANQLYKYTQLQTYYSIQMLALVNGEPRNLSLKRALSIYIEHRYDVIVRRTQFELEKQRARAHILIGLLKAVSDIDAVIRTIRSADDVEDARQKLMSFFELSEPQANAILDMQLRRLAALERQKLQDEYDEVQARIAYLEELLGDPHMILQVIRQDVTEIAEHYGDSRRTRVADFETDLDESDLHQDEKVIISLTHRGYIKRVPLRMYKEQRRGGRGVKGMETRDEDFLLDVFFANSKDTVLFFSNRGKVYSAPAYRIPEAGRAQKGTIIHTVLNMSTDEQITAVMPIRDFSNSDATVVMATRHGRIKRVPLEEFADVRNAGLIATFLHEGDTLNWVKYSDGNQHVILVTEHGQSIRFPETEVRVMGRMAGGVNAIRLMEDDVVAGMDILQSDLHTHILVVTENGYGKRTPIDQYNTQSRYGLGSRTLARNERTGKIIAMRCINKDDSIMILSRGGIIIRTKLAQIRETGRSTMGVTVMNLTGVDQVVGIAIFNDDEDDEIPVDSGASTGEAPGEVVNDGLPPEAENGTITES